MLTARIIKLTYTLVAVGGVIAVGAAVVPATPAAPPVHDLTVTAFDYAFQMPDTVRSGLTRIRLVNQGPELHHVSVVRLEQGKRLADIFTALQAGGPPPAWATDVGGPNTPAPGAESVAIVDLTAGRYAVLCFIPSPDGKPHVMKGMARELVVVPASAAAASGGDGTAASARDIAPTVTMTLTDYAFNLSEPITAGRQVIQVRTDASQPHEVLVARLAPGKSVGDLLAWIEKPQGPPPGVPMGGTTGIAQGGENLAVIDFTPGEYALLCFIPDAKDGKPHFAHGMMKQITVK